MGALLAIALAVLAAVPAYVMQLSGVHPPVAIATLLFGMAIVGAAFAMSWGAEAAEHDIPRALALTAVALLAVFPEYAVDFIFAYKAGQDPSFERRAATLVEASPPARDVEPVYQRMELDAYLRVWRAMHPGVDAAIAA